MIKTDMIDWGVTRTATAKREANPRPFVAETEPSRGRTSERKTPRANPKRSESPCKLGVGMGCGLGCKADKKKHTPEVTASDFIFGDSNVLEKEDCVLKFASNCDSRNDPGQPRLTRSSEERTQPKSSEKSVPTPNRFICYLCNEPGHRSADCSTRTSGKDSMWNLKTNISDIKLVNDNESYNSSSSYESAKRLSSSMEKLLLIDDSPSPRGLTRHRRESIGTAQFIANALNAASRAPTPRAEPENLIQFEKPRNTPMDAGNVTTSDFMTIETRRTIHRHGDIAFQETTIIQFPRNLPKNVHVVTAQFPPIGHN